MNEIFQEFSLFFDQKPKIILNWFYKIHELFVQMVKWIATIIQRDWQFCQTWRKHNLHTIRQNKITRHAYHRESTLFEIFRLFFMLKWRGFVELSLSKSAATSYNHVHRSEMLNKYRNPFHKQVHSPEECERQ